MTLSEFRASRVWSRSIGSVIRDMSLEGVSGYVYLGRYYIETTGSHLCVDLGGCDEHYALNSSETLSRFEALLHGFAKQEI